MARMKRPSPRETPHFSVRTISLAAEEVALLRRLSQEASDFLGRTTSSSAVIRALLRQIGKQGPPAADALFVEIERELKDGVMWGNKKK
jgi:hypothetical protein